MNGFAVFRPGMSYDKNLSSLRSVQAAFLRTKSRFRNQMVRVQQSTQIDIDDQAQMLAELKTAWSGAVQFIKTLEVVLDMPEYELASRRDCTLDVDCAVNSVAPDFVEAINA